MNNLKAVSSNEFVVQISANLQYLKTYNYDLFSFYPSNRTPTHWKTILQSIEIQDLTDRQPILVYKCPKTGMLYISDGQNRFLACKNSKRPVYAIVVVGESLEKGESSLSVLNSYQKNWGLTDYLDYFCAKGFADYMRVRNCVLDNPSFSVGTIIKIVGASSGAKKTTRTEAFRSGTYKFTDKDTNSARIINKCYHSVLSNKMATINISSIANLQKAITSILKGGAKSRVLISKLQKYGHLITDCGATKNWVSLLNHIYNYRVHESNRIDYTRKSNSAGQNIEIQ